MFVLMHVVEAKAERNALTAELMAELAEMRAVGMKLIRQFGRRMDEEPDLAASNEMALRFSRVAKTVSRIGALQLALLDDHSAFARAAEHARRGKADAQARQGVKAGAERKMRCAYLFDQAVLEPAADSLEADDVETMRRDLFAWLFDDADAAACANLSTGDIMIKIARQLGLEPARDPAAIEAWEATVRERWAPLDVEEPPRPGGPPGPSPPDRYGGRPAILDLIPLGADPP